MEIVAQPFLGPMAPWLVLLLSCSVIAVKKGEISGRATIMDAIINQLVVSKNWMRGMKKQILGKPQPVWFEKRNKDMQQGLGREVEVGQGGRMQRNPMKSFWRIETGHQRRHAGKSRTGKQSKAKKRREKIRNKKRQDRVFQRWAHKEILHIRHHTDHHRAFGRL